MVRRGNRHHPQREAAEAMSRLNEMLEQQVAERTRVWRLSTDIVLVARFDGTITATIPA